MRAVSNVAPDWWDYMTHDEKLSDAASLSPEDVLGLPVRDFP